jgi:tRNA nucleotidyltransferase (CCA-adding enzyme)
MTKDMAAIWADGMRVARMLEEAGHRAFLVGGCVRDRLLGRPLKDADIATSARPRQVMEIFPDAIPTGLRFGTVSVRMNGRLFEVTTFRSEAGYSDGRHPDRVSFVGDIREDLARRDFTINAMAAGTDGELIDPFGGRDDLAAGVVRCVGRAEERFAEDALRMLRGIRIAAELGFRLAPSVWKAILRQRERLRLVAMERVAAELDRMTAGRDPDRAWTLLIRSGLALSLKEILPVPDPERLQSVRLAAVAEAELRWPLLWIAGGGDEGAAEDAARKLRLSRARGERWKGAVGLNRRLGPVFGSPDQAEARETWIGAVMEWGRAAAVDWLALSAGLLSVPREVSERASRWLRDMPACSVGELAVRGGDLARHLQRPRGPWVGLMLRRLLKETAAGRVSNDRESLLELARRFSTEEG